MQNRSFVKCLGRSVSRILACSPLHAHTSGSSRVTRASHEITALNARSAIVRSLSSSGASHFDGNTIVGRCEDKLTRALAPTHLQVKGQHDDPNGSHIVVEIVSAAFEGKNAVMRQRLVYKALWDEMSTGGSLHAVDRINAMTPTEYLKSKNTSV